LDKIRVLVADDHEITRRGICSLLRQQGWEVVGEAANGRDAVAKAKLLRPDVSVLDISMPELNGLDATRQMLKDDSDCKVLILTMHQSDSLMVEALGAGVRGYLLKSASCRDLAVAVESVSANKPFFTSTMSDLILDGSSSGRPAELEPGSHNPLTPRQREIVQLLAEGKTSKGVAATLEVSVKTVETHRANIMRRLKLHTVSQLVRYAIRNRIVQA
jgi:DNA-binding NarL/FixJ family response regulator